MIHRDSNAIANQVRMHRSQHSGAFVLVEGKDDKLFFRRFLDQNLAVVIVADGKEKVCDAIATLDRDQFPGVLGIVDADFDHLEGRTVDSPNVLFTEFHDLECVQLWSAGLEAIITEYGSEKKLTGFNRDPLETLLKAARPIGCLRLHSERKGLALRFKGLSYGNFVERSDLTTDKVKLVNEVKKRSNRADLSDDSLVEVIREIEKAEYDEWQLCSGPDLLGILAIGLRYLFGSQSSGSVDQCFLRRALRLSFGVEVFNQTQIKGLLGNWEKRNTGFGLL